jgi:hypothetical protein
MHQLEVVASRTIDTWIFSSSESLVRCEEAEERERVFAPPTEPPRPTEPMPNPTVAGRPNPGAGAMSAMGFAPSGPSGDRTAGANRCLA